MGNLYLHLLYFRIKKDLDLILKTIKIDVHHPEENTALVLLVSLVGSSGRQAHVCSFFQLAAHISGEIKA